MQQQHMRRDSSPAADLSASSESPARVKKKRKSPLFSKAKSCLKCRDGKLRCDMEWPCSNCVRRGLAESCPGFVVGARLAREAPPPRPSRSSTSLSRSAEPRHGDSPATVARHGGSWATVGTEANCEDVAASLTMQLPLRTSSSAIGVPSSSGRLPQYYGQSAHSSYLASSFPSPPSLGSGEAHANSAAEQPRRTGQASWEQLDADYRFFSEKVQGMDVSILKDFHASISWMFCPFDETRLESVFDAEENDMMALCLVIKVVVFAWQTAVQRDRSSTDAGSFCEVAFQQCWRSLDKAEWSRCNSLTIQQALFLLCLFLLNFEGGQMSDRFSSVFGICVSKAIESGLYIDSKVGQGGDSSVQRKRQRLFWELYSLDAFRSLAYCRPCFFQNTTITVAKPSVTTDDDAFHAIKYENAQIINRFMTHHLHSFGTKFQETMELDLQVRQLFERIPPHLRVRRISRLSSSGSGRQQTPRQVLQGCTIALNIHQTVLTLYRPWFVSTTLEEVQGKGDRNSTEYQRARLRLGESASAMIELCSHAYTVDPQTTMHWAFFLHHTFNAGVCRAMQAIYGNASDPLFYNAIDDVDEAMALLERTQDHGCGQVWLPRAHVLRKLRQRSIARVTNGAACSGEQSRRASFFRLLDATVPLDPDSSSTGAAAQQGQQLVPGAESPHTNNDAGSDPPDDAISSGWLELLNNDVFTLPMAELFNAHLPSLINPQDITLHDFQDPSWNVQ